MKDIAEIAKEAAGRAAEKIAHWLDLTDNSMYFIEDTIKEEIEEAAKEN